MSDTSIAIEKRTDKGKAHVRRLRKTGRIPAVFYGEAGNPQTLSLDTHGFELILREGHSILSLDIEGKEHQAIVREIQRHPVSGDILHVDFFEVKKGQKIQLDISVTIEGKAKGIAEGGRFAQVKNEMNISVLPKDMPDEIVVNIEELSIGDAIRVRDIELENVEFLDDPDDVICKVDAPKEEEEEEEEEEFDEEESAEPEVITSREKDEDETDE